MTVISSTIFSLVKVIGVFTLLIGGIYGILIPTFFPAYKTYSILLIGVGVSALIGGYIGYCYSFAGTLSVKVVSIVLSAAIVAICVAYLSLWIILNVRGT